MPKTKIYSEEEALQRRRDRNNAYHKQRYQNDPEFRQRKIDRSVVNNALQYEKTKQKLERLKELEQMIENNKNNATEP